MLTQETITDREFVESRSWYQTIDFGDGLKSKGCEWCGDPAWQNIRKYLPENLEGKRVLDLGCNAGLFCVRMALMGAKEVIGVDWKGWRPGWDFEEQQVFVKDYFERKTGKKLPITYINMKMEDYVNDSIGHFDYVLAIASIYYADRAEELVRNLGRIADNLIVRLRDESIMEKFRKLFHITAFSEIAGVRENWGAILGKPADDFFLYHYTKREGVEVAYYKIVEGHKDLLNVDEAVHIWTLMDLVRTELKDHKNYELPFSARYIKMLPLKKFLEFRDSTDCPKINWNDKYDWKWLIESIKNEGMKIPLIVEEVVKEGEIWYQVLEGRHRVTALAAIEPYDPDRTVPALIVRKEYVLR